MKNQKATRSALPLFFTCVLMGSMASTQAIADVNIQSSNISIQGHQLLVEDAAYDIRGVCYNPVVKNGTHPFNLATFATYALDQNGQVQFDANGRPLVNRGGSFDIEQIKSDLALMKEAHINTIRTYEVIRDHELLDVIDSYGIKVVVPIMFFYSKSDQEIINDVTALKDHPSTLFWEIGNEWNYNQFYQYSGNNAAAIERIKHISDLIRSVDTSHPVSTSYGYDVPSDLITTLQSHVDIWGLNIYAGISFNNVLENWKNKSTKPIYIAEYGADAMNTQVAGGVPVGWTYDEASQAEATLRLTTLIKDQLSSNNSGAVIGGTIFEFNDEWWKAGDAWTQDNGGIAPGAGPYPDYTFNEEWWGLVDIDRVPRKAFYELKAVYETYGSSTTLPPVDNTPIRIEAESFEAMDGVVVGPTADASDGMEIGYLDAGDWAAYGEVSVPKSGNYKLEMRISSLNGGGYVNFEEAGGAPVYTSLAIPATGGWDKYDNISTTVFLEEGNHRFGLGVSVGEWNLDWFSLTPIQ